MAKIVENTCITPFNKDSYDTTDLDILIYPDTVKESCVCLRITAIHSNDVNQFEAIEISVGRYWQPFVTLFSFDDVVNYNDLSMLGRQLVDDNDMMHAITAIYKGEASIEARSLVETWIKKRFDNPGILVLEEMIKESGLSREDFFKEQETSEETYRKMLGIEY